MSGDKLREIMARNESEDLDMVQCLKDRADLIELVLWDKAFMEDQQKRIMRMTPMEFRVDFRSKQCPQCEGTGRIE